MTIDNHPWNQTISAKAHVPETEAQTPATQGTITVGRCLFFGKVIDAIARGYVFRTYLSRFLKLAAAAIAFTGFVALFHAWQFTSHQEAPGIIGGIVYMFFLSTGMYMVVHDTIIRADHIASVPDGEFTIIPICALLALLVGEAYAAFSTSVSIGGGILIWFTQNDAYKLLQDIAPFVPDPGGSDFLGGSLFMIWGLVRAAAVLTGAYLISELLRVVTKLAENRSMAPANKG